MNASSDGSSSSATKWSTASRASTIGWPRMLSLASRRTPRLTGILASVNWVVSWRSPSSKISKSSFVSPVIGRPDASTTLTVTWTVSTPPRNFWTPCVESPPDGHSNTVSGNASARRVGANLCAMALPYTRVPTSGVVPPALDAADLARADSGSSLYARVIVLEGAHRERLGSECADRADRRRRTRERRNARHLRHRGRAPDGAVVKKRFPPQRRVDDQIDISIDQVIRNVRTALVHLVNDLR